MLCMVWLLNLCTLTVWYPEGFEKSLPNNSKQRNCALTIWVWKDQSSVIFYATKISEAFFSLSDYKTKPRETLLPFYVDKFQSLEMSWIFSTTDDTITLLWTQIVKRPEYTKSHDFILFLSFSKYNNVQPLTPKTVKYITETIQLDLIAWSVHFRKQNMTSLLYPYKQTLHFFSCFIQKFIINGNENM